MLICGSGRAGLATTPRAALAVAVTLVATLVLAASLHRRRKRKWRGQAVLSDEQKRRFLRDGVLVVPGVLTAEEVAATRDGLHAFLWARHGVDAEDLDGTAGRLRELSSTNGCANAPLLVHARASPVRAGGKRHLCMLTSGFR